MEPYWFVNLDGRNVGPLNLSTLAEKIRSQEVSLETPVWCDGMPDWVVLKNSELLSFYEETLRPMPPPFDASKFENTQSENSVEKSSSKPFFELPSQPPPQETASSSSSHDSKKENANGGLDLPVEYAGFWVRAFAFWIDQVLLFFFGHFMSIIFPFNGMMDFHFGFFSRGSFFGLFLYLLYFGVFQAYFKGTLGKKAMGIVVVSHDFTPMTIEVGVLRFLVFLASNSFCFLGSLWVIFDLKKQGLYDKFARTYVIYTRP